MIGSIYAAPGLILHSAGSVGVALILWVLGSLIAAAGTYVYLEYGTVSSLIFDNWCLLIPRFPESTEKRRREELPRIYLSSTSIPHDVYICCLLVRRSQFTCI